MSSLIPGSSQVFHIHGEARLMVEYSLSRHIHSVSAVEYNSIRYVCIHCMLHAWVVCALQATDTMMYVAKVLD